MGQLKLVKGPAGSGKTAWAVAHCLHKIHQRTPLTVLLPSQGLIQDFQQRLSATEGFTGALHLEFHTFYSFVKKYSYLASRSIKELDSSASPLVLNYFLEKHGYKYPHLLETERTDGYLRALSAYFRDMADGGLDIEQTRRLCKEPALQNYSGPLQQIHQLYGDFSTFLTEHGFALREQLFLQLWQHLDEAENSELSGRTFVIDGFYDFTPMQRLLLTQLLEIGTNCSITLLTGKEHLFDYVRETEQWLDSLIKEHEGTVTKLPAASTLLPDIAKLFRHTEENAPPSELERIEATGIPLEVQEVVRRIKKALLTGAFTPDEIAVIYRRENDYYSRFVAHFRREGIPLDGGVEQPLNTNPAMNALLQWYEVLASDFSREEVLRWLQSNYITPPPAQTNQQVARLAQLAGMAQIIGGKSDWLLRLRELLARSQTSVEHDDLTEVMQIQPSDTRLIHDLEQFFEKLPKMQIVDWETHIKNLRHTIRLTRFEQQLRQPLNSSDNGDGERIIARDLRAFTRLTQVLESIDQMSRTLSLPKVSTERFAQTLREFMEQTSYQTEGKERAGVTLTTVEGARGRFWKQVYLVGMIDGLFPVQWRAHPLVKVDDRIQVNRLLPDGRKIVEHRADLREEQLLFYIALTRATQHICLSTIKGPEDSLPSPFYDEICQFYSGSSGSGDPGDAATAQVVTPEYCSFDPQSSWLQVDLLQHLGQLDDFKDVGLPISSQLFRHLKEVSRQRSGPEFGVYDGHLVSEAIQDRLAEKLFNPVAPLSASRLETYYSSPFRYFATYLLHLEEIEEVPEELPPRDRGRILHRILEQFYRYMTSEHRGQLDTSNRDVALAKLDRILQNVCDDFKHHFAAIPDLLWKREQELLRHYSHNAVVFFSQTSPWSDPGLVPEFFEWEFGTGREGSHPPFELSTDKKTVTFKGIVDRLDRNTATGEFTVIDYKTSRGKAVKDFWNGRALQLQIYALAARRLLEPYVTPVRLSYYSLRKSREDGKINGHATNMEDLFTTAEQHIWKAIDSMEQGIFHPVAGECDPYCPVKSICRCDENRIRMKQN